MALIQNTRTTDPELRRLDAIAFEVSEVEIHFTNHLIEQGLMFPHDCPQDLQEPIHISWMDCCPH